MATISSHHTTLNVPHVAGRPTITPNGAVVDFHTPWIVANGAILLKGTAGESVANWTLGFVQLKFIGTDYARYRGATVRQGSVKLTKNNQLVLRDQLESAKPGIWYDPVAASGRGTRVAPSGSVIPASGEFHLESSFSDSPGREHPGQVTNGRTHSPNFLHQSDIALHFCTMLVAQDPAGNRHPLKHFYWNVRWEAFFQPAAATGNPTLKSIHLHELNVQRHVHSGLSNDERFKGKEFDTHLQVSNDISRRLPTAIPSSDWSEG